MVAKVEFDEAEALAFRTGVEPVSSTLDASIAMTK